MSRESSTEPSSTITSTFGPQTTLRWSQSLSAIGGFILSYFKRECGCLLTANNLLTRSYVEAPY
jgi:hypothetical protein